MTGRAMSSMLVHTCLIAVMTMPAIGAAAAAQLQPCAIINHQCKLTASHNYRQCAVYPYQRAACAANLQNQNRACFNNFQRCLHYNACISGYRSYCRYLR